MRGAIRRKWVGWQRHPPVWLSEAPERPTPTSLGIPSEGGLVRRTNVSSRKPRGVNEPPGGRAAEDEPSRVQLETNQQHRADDGQDDGGDVDKRCACELDRNDRHESERGHVDAVEERSGH